jgi:hypothetical protein
LFLLAFFIANSNLKCDCVCVHVFSYSDKNFPCVIDLFIVDQKSRSGVPELMARVVEVAEKRKLINLRLNPA